MATRPLSHLRFGRREALDPHASADTGKRARGLPRPDGRAQPVKHRDRFTEALAGGATTLCTSLRVAQDEQGSRKFERKPEAARKVNRQLRGGHRSIRLSARSADAVDRVAASAGLDPNPNRPSLDG